MFLQRWLQNGLNALVGAYTLSPPQLGQLTILGSEFFGVIIKSLTRPSAQSQQPAALSAKRELKFGIFSRRMQAIIALMAHQPDRRHQAVGADFRHQTLG